MELMDVIKILSLFALIAFIILSVYFIIALKSINKFLYDSKATLDELADSFLKALEKITADVNQLKTEAIESLNHIDEVSIQLVATTKNLEEQASGILNILQPIGSLITTVATSFIPIVNKTSVYAGAISKAISVFTNMWLAKK